MTMTRPTISLLAGVLAAAAAALPAAAKTSLLTVHNDWEAYAFAEKAGKVCYAASLPKKTAGSASGRETFVSVTHRPAEKAKNVFSVTAGYVYRDGSAVEVDIDTQKFKLFTSGDGAWARDAATDEALVTALKKGRTLIVRGTPAKGAETVDTYSLSGFTAAHGEIGKACAVK